MLRVFTAFSGYDSQCMALDRLGIDYELVGWSEIDKYAIMAHNAVYPQWAERNCGNICKIDWSQVADFDLFTYSSPCQDFSQAGKQAGGEQGSGTRSSLLWECERAIREKRPKYLVFENVAALVSKKFIKLFIEWQLVLEGYGYSNFCKVMNAKDYGIPQNRKRIFMVSVLDEAARYEFPNPIPLTICLKDVLEKDVNERYYLSEQQINMFNTHAERNNRVGGGFGWNPTDGNVIANTLLASGNLRPHDNYIVEPVIEQRGHGFNKGGKHKITPTITGSSWSFNNLLNNGLHTRRLTERECFRLMDVPEEYIDKIQASGVSKSQQYKIAGNSIVVACLYHIFDKLLVNNKEQLTLF